MIRTCPKCGDYYADGSLAFCLADGTPLVDVDQLSESWGEAARVVEEKENALRRRRRKLKWRRVVLTVTTVLMTTIIVCVVVINSIIYLRPRPTGTAPERPLLQATTTAPDDPAAPASPAEPVPSLSPRPTETTTPTRDPESLATPTPASPASPTPSPRVTTSPTTPTPTPVPECSDADKNREREAIIRSFGYTWRREVEGNRRKLIARRVLSRAGNSEATLGAVEYEITFSQACKAAVVRVRYVWQVRTNVNGTIMVVPVPEGKRFDCVKVGDAWRCG
jgi:hypothetical protein